MYLVWSSGRCVVCLREDTPPSDEHLIPASLGGRLVVRGLLCKPCNDDLGHRVEADARADPAVRLAVENLRNKLPASLAADLDKRLGFVADSNAGTVAVTLGGEGPRLRPERDESGAFTKLDTRDARRLLEAESMRSGASPTDVAEALAAFDAAPEGQYVEFPGRIGAMKHEIRNVQPALDADLMSEILPLKAAYEFLALGVEGEIFAPALDPVREAIRGSEGVNDDFSIENLRGSYAPVHQLRLWTGEDDHVIVDVVLFGWIVYRVHLHRVALRPTKFGYEIDLAASRDYFVVPGEPGV